MNNAITKQLQNPLPENVLKTRKEKSLKAREDMIEAVKYGKISPARSHPLGRDDPSTWISVSDVTDASLHRLACRTFTEGIANLRTQIGQLYTNVNMSYIESLLGLRDKVKYLIEESLGHHLLNMSSDESPDDIVGKIMAGTSGMSAGVIASHLINYWTKQAPRGRGSRRGALYKIENNIYALRQSFLDDVAYRVSDINPSLDTLTFDGGTLELYSNYPNIDSLQTKIDKMESLGISGVFQHLYAATKGYSNPVCRACLYSPKSKTFWYSLRPLTLEHDDRDIKHTFNGLWVSWDYQNFVNSIGTYSENALSVYRIGDHIEDESASHSHFHPHVGESGTLCLGGAHSMYTMANDSMVLSSSMDIVIGVLNAYAPSDAYSKLERFTMTIEEWAEEHRDSDDEDYEGGPYCGECGDEVDTDEDVYDDDSWYHRDDCCHYSEWTGEYVRSSNAVYSEHHGTYLDGSSAVHTFPTSTTIDHFPTGDSDNIRQLWIPDTWHNIREEYSQSFFSIHNMYAGGICGNSPDNCTGAVEGYPGGCIVYICTSDDPDDEIRYVPLSSFIYSKLSSYHYHVEGSLTYDKITPDYIWGRVEDCVCVILNNCPNTKHCVLKHHVENTDIIPKALAASELVCTIQGPMPIKQLEKIKENEETS